MNEKIDTDIGELTQTNNRRTLRTRDLTKNPRKKTIRESWKAFDNERKNIIIESDEDKSRVKIDNHIILEKNLPNQGNTDGVRELCDTCKSMLAFSEEGFLTCVNPECSIMYTDLVDRSPEWRYYGNDDSKGSDPTRCGMPINPLLEDSAYGCKVSYAGKMTRYVHQMRRFTEYQAITHREKTRFREFQRIMVLAQNAGIAKIFVDDALVFHKQISESDNTFRGDNKDGIIASSIYMSCRKNGHPRTDKEIAEIFYLDQVSATHGCKRAQFILNQLEQNMEPGEKTVFCIPKPQDFIERYCTRLNINSELTRLCEFISMKIHSKSIMTGNTPTAIASGIVFFISHICNLNIGKREIHKVSGTSEVTINKCYKKIDMIKNELLPTSIKNKYCKPIATTKAKISPKSIINLPTTIIDM